MTHYNKTEWQAYKNNLVGVNQKIKMEEHLYQCDLCLDIYLQTIEPNEVEQAKSMLPIDFGGQVLRTIKVSKNPKPPARNAQKSSASENTRLLLYYGLAASIAVFFTFNGYFDTFTDKIPANIGGLPVLEAKFDRGAPGGWSTDLVEKTTNWIDVLIDNKEVIGE